MARDFLVRSFGGKRGGSLTPPFLFLLSCSVSVFSKQLTSSYITLKGYILIIKSKESLSFEFIATAITIFREIFEQKALVMQFPATIMTDISS